jgi:hypothetical protein
VNYNKGLKKEAKAMFKKALTINPDNSYAKDMLKELEK